MPSKVSPSGCLLLAVQHIRYLGVAETVCTDYGWLAKGPRHLELGEDEVPGPGVFVARDQRVGRGPSFRPEHVILVWLLGL
jgi:hypothetical protein